MENKKNQHIRPIKSFTFPIENMRVLDYCRSKSGIYAVENTKTGDLYIGSAVTGEVKASKGLYKRYRAHLVEGKSPSKRLREDIANEGIEQFSFHVLET